MNALKEEVNRILDPTLRELTEFVLERHIPDTFWFRPSTSSGKYHPPDENSRGGMVLHTQRVCKIAELLMKGYPPPFRADCIRVACILHDMGRYGKGGKAPHSMLREHPIIGAEMFTEAANAYVESLREEQLSEISNLSICVIEYAIKSHMGKWGMDKPKSPEDWIVHFSDLIAASIHEVP